MSEPEISFKSLLTKLARVEEKTEEKKFDPGQHGAEARLTITKLFLKWYFCLIAGSFIFCLAYNFIAASINHNLTLTGESIIPYLELTNTVSLITTTLSSGLGFVIGYYFKNKGE